MSIRNKYFYSGKEIMKQLFKNTNVSTWKVNTVVSGLPKGHYMCNIKTIIIINIKTNVLITLTRM